MLRKMDQLQEMLDLALEANQLLGERADENAEVCLQCSLEYSGSNTSKTNI